MLLLRGNIIRIMLAKERKNGLLIKRSAPQPPGRRRDNWTHSRNNLTYHTCCCCCWQSFSLAVRCRWYLSGKRVLTFCMPCNINSWICTANIVVCQESISLKKRFIFSFNRTVLRSYFLAAWPSTTHLGCTLGAFRILQFSLFFSFSSTCIGLMVFHYLNTFTFMQMVEGEILRFNGGGWIIYLLNGKALFKISSEIPSSTPDKAM